MKRLPHCIMVYEHHTGSLERFMPVNGLILALCTGEMPVDTIKRCVSACFDWTLKKTDGVLRTFFADYPYYIEMLDAPQALETGYSFSRFVYRPGACPAYPSEPLFARITLPSGCCGEADTLSLPAQLTLAQALAEQHVVELDIDVSDAVQPNGFARMMELLSQKRIQIAIRLRGAQLPPACLEALQGYRDTVIELEPSAQDGQGSTERMAKQGTHVRCAARFAGMRQEEITAALRRWEDIGVGSLRVAAQDVDAVCNAIHASGAGNGLHILHEGTPRHPIANGCTVAYETERLCVAPDGAYAIGDTPLFPQDGRQSKFPMLSTVDAWHSPAARSVLEAEEALLVSFPP